MKTFIAAIATTIALSSMLGCTVGARSPEPVPLDRVECARCRMLISTEAGAGQIVSPSADTRFYDDIACLATDVIRDEKHGSAFIHTDKGWVDVRSASFAQPVATRTAMGSGFVAFTSIDEARGADRAGRVFTWYQIVQFLGAGK